MMLRSPFRSPLTVLDSKDRARQVLDDAAIVLLPRATDEQRAEWIDKAIELATAHDLSQT